MRRFIISLVLVPLLCASATSQGRKEAVIIFKDGFFLSGKVVEKRTYFIDPVSGQSFTIPVSGGFINLDDFARRMYFIPGQLQEVLEKKNIERDLIDLKRYANTSRPDKILPGWQVDTVVPFNAKWERGLKVNVAERGPFIMDQRIIQMNPHFLHIQTLKYDWDPYYLTREFSPAEIRTLLSGYFSDKKDLKDWDKRKAIAMFLHQGDWHQEAQKDLDDLVAEYPSKKESVAGLQETLKKILADAYVEAMSRASKAGQHQTVRTRLDLFAKEKMAPLVSEKNLLLVQDLKSKYEGLDEKIGEAKAALASVLKRHAGGDGAVWASAVNLISEELNADTAGKLDTFLTFARQHLREAEEKTPSQTPEQVLALAVSGWLLGNAAAEPDIKNAQLLLRARAMVLEYQKTVNTVVRNQLLASVFQSGTLSVDILARLIKNMPPPFPYEKSKIGTDPVKLEIDLPDSRGGSYYVQLPPDYHHQHSYPVLLLLHGSYERADATLKRLGPLAAAHGFILAAPLWGGAGASAAYGYTANEHAAVLDTLRDLRRRFQIDSDRVFLFGWQQGADAALDIGMGHPDQFAGVLPMCGAPRYFTAERNRYLSNAQYLPFYLVDGDRDGANPKAILWMFKEWISGGYPALYVEYKGRGSEWYQAELPRMFDWMTRKKRHHPTKEMGRGHTAGGIGEEFRTMRECDNRFYWLSTDNIDPRYLNSPSSWVRTIPAATMQAGISVGNDLVKKEAKIYSQINIQTKGLRQVTLWLAPSMVDFSKPVRIRVNGGVVGGDRLLAPNPADLMDDFSHNGDRQRLFFAKVVLKF